MIMEYHLSEDAYKEYISVTKNNENTSYESAGMKLNRNIILGKLIYDDTYALKYQYGSLVIEVLFGEISRVYKSNYRRKFSGKKRYNLNKQLQIT